MGGVGSRALAMSVVMGMELGIRAVSNLPA
jgi:hypothetical protein